MKCPVLLLIGLTFLGVALPPTLAQKGKPAPAANVKLKQTEFEDGTGSIGLAPGWQIASAFKGSVQCAGPNSAFVVLKMPWAVMRTNSSLRSLPAAENTPIADPDDLVGALREILQKHFGATLKTVRGKQAGEVAPGTPAYILIYTYTLKGKAMTSMGYFAPLVYGPEDSWQLYSSAVGAPSAQFPKMLKTMVTMWRSWRPNGKPPSEGSASAVWDTIIKDRQESFDRIQKEFRKLL